jgi:regulator of replication initiation timing
MWSVEKKDNDWLRKQNKELFDQNKHLTWQVNTTKQFYETMRDWAEFLVEQKWKVMKENEELKSKIGL